MHYSRLFPLFGLSILALCGTFRTMAQIERVDPTAELRREGTFVDASRVELATADQQQQWLAKQTSAEYFVFTEGREHEIRFDDRLPLAWLSRNADERVRFQGTPQPGETYLWQIGVYAPQQALRNVTLQFDALIGPSGDTIPASAFECYNLGGVDKDGKRFVKQVNVPEGKLQALWIGVNVPLKAYGLYRGNMTVRAEGASETRLEIALDVQGDPLPDGGIHDAWRKSRIRWINSTLGRSEEPTAPYTPLKRSENRISYLGGEVTLTSEGLPAAIVTHYDRSNQLDASVENNILAAPVRFEVETGKGVQTFRASKLRFTEETPATLCWQTTLTNRDLELDCRGVMHFDGSINYRLALKARREIQVKDIRARFDLTRYASKYLMGLGHKGGQRPEETLRWSWDTTRQQDQLWLGNINAGLNIHLKDSNYRRPLVNIYYHFGRLQYPHSWGNDHRGGIEITPSETATSVKAYSGERTLRAGETQRYDFELMITPVKPIDFAHHFTERFYHLNADTSGGFIPTALAYGANLINVHHKADIYPFLNYPMEDQAVGGLKAFIERAHAAGLGVRTYYTCRELTVKTPEFWILRSLGGEILFDGPGNEARTLIHPDGPKPWLRENLRAHYLPAWYAAFNEGRFKGELDIAVIATPESRWSNYFLEGLNWMVRELAIDGIYVDDSSLDPESMRRARRILDADGRRRLVDMHTWNHMNEHAGYANSLQLYFGLLPYVNRLWIGELFRADNPRDFWLVEMSGIPFGLMSETLDAHNLFRGMVFGMLPRLPWSGNPAPMWKLLDRFEISQARMYGYWDERNPVTDSDNEQLPVTVYLNEGKALVVVANWSDTDAASRFLQLDPAKLGFTPRRAYLPEIEELQTASEIDLDTPVEIPAASGKIILLE